MTLNLNFTLKALEMRGVLICFFGGRHLLGGVAGDCYRQEETKGEEPSSGALLLLLMK